MRKYLLITLFFAFILPVYSQDSENIKELTILHWNDFHARNMPYKINKKDSLGNQYQVFVGGTSGMLGYLNKYRNTESLVLNGGDDYQGTPISSITKGFSQIELLDLYNLDAFVLGNHDFDYGMYTLDSALRNANFNYLSANLSYKASGKPFAKPYLIKEVNGIKIGIIGLSPMDLMTLTVPKNVSDLQVLNIDSIIPVYVNILKKEKCNLIILLSHNGEDNDKEFAEKFHKDIDIIIGGHSHTPIFRLEIVDGTIICQAGSYGRWLGKLDVKVDVSKDTVIKCYGKLYETIFDSSVYDKHAQVKVENMLAAIEPEMKKPIGSALSDLNKSSLGQWQADAIKEKLGTDISFLNAGSIRKNLIKGNITIGDVWEINPFGNTMMKFSVSGKTLKNMIANSIRMANKSKDNSDYDNVIVSGMYVEFHSKSISDESDDFITKFLIDGKDLELNKSYSISTNNYMVSQLKKYFGDITEDVKSEDTNILDRDLIIEAVEQQKDINPVFEKRIVDLDKE